MQGLARGILASAAALAAGAAAAADLPTKKGPPPPAIPLLPPSPWRFELTGYGWERASPATSALGRSRPCNITRPSAKCSSTSRPPLWAPSSRETARISSGLDTIWSRIGGSGTVRVKDAPLRAT